MNGGSYMSTGNLRQPAKKTYSPIPTISRRPSSGGSMSIGGMASGINRGGSDLSALLANLKAMQGPTLVTEQTTQNARSPELEAQIQAQTGRLNALQSGYEGAYDAKQETYNDVIQSLINAYQSQGSRQGAATSTSALASGLTPLEAAGAAGDVRADFLQQMWPQVAGLRADQADVGIGLQEAIQGVDQEYANLLAGVIAPYQQGVAGTTVAGEETDYLGIQKLLADVAMQEEAQRQQASSVSAQLSNALEIARMQEAGAMERAMMGERGATQRTGMTQSGATGRAQMDIGAQRAMTNQKLYWIEQQNAIARQQEDYMARLRADLTGGLNQEAWERQNNAPTDFINSLSSWLS